MDEKRIEITLHGIEVYGKKSWYFVSNFGMKLLYRIVDHHDNVTWQAVIQQHEQDDIFVEFSNDELANQSKFHAVLLKHGFVFKGGNYELNLLKEDLVSEAQHAEHITSLGHHKDSGLYFFANGGLDQKTGIFHTPDQYHIITHDEGAYYLPYESYAHLKQYQSLCRYWSIENKDVCFDSWSSSFADAFGIHSLAPLCHSIAALFRDIAFEKVHFFPISYNRGPKGTGKSTMSRSLTAMYGTPQKEFSLKSPNTTKSLPRTLEQIKNGILWLDEYHNALPVDVLGTIQSIYDGGGYAKALRDNTNLTTSVEVQSGIILTSNVTPDDEVFISRCIVCTFNDTRRSQEQIQAFERLKDMETGNLSCLSVELLKQRELIQKNWFSTYKMLKGYFKKTTEGIPDRIFDNIAVCLTPAYILESHKKIHLKAAYDLTMTLKEWGRQLCLLQHGILTGRSDLHLFFEVVSSGVDTGKLRPDYEYSYFSPQKSEGLCLALNVSKVMSFYLKEYRSMYNKIGLRRDEIENLLESCPAYMGTHNVKMRPPKGGRKVPYKVPIFKQSELFEHFGVSWPHPIFSRKI